MLMNLHKKAEALTGYKSAAKKDIIDKDIGDINKGKGSRNATPKNGRSHNKDIAKMNKHVGALSYGRKDQNFMCMEDLN
jgi:hypothetical protein